LKLLTEGTLLFIKGSSEILHPAEKDGNKPKRLSSANLEEQTGKAGIPD
jgi:hypothetical protein